ncbi:ATP-dependent helicase HrpB [Paenibacillus sp. GCM10027629]|uniref:ATP-dependent helicase HrpB n=1 Tax=Paenibacillus sp. GCM10027629 TaxID=3273414 RepID=UPI00362E9477
MVSLPIHAVIPQLRESLEIHQNAVLIAAPGAGKTTQVPLALRDADWLEDRRIIMLEPRRIAARASARFMASSLGEQVGETVGYRVRHDTRVGPKTRIEVVTEGVLTRMLQEDPMLTDVGLVIFDEFHERSLHADLGLALALEAQSVFREDLRILVMSATLDAEPVAALLENAPVITSEGRVFPVETVYSDRRSDAPMEAAVGAAVIRALGQDEGDILVFLPGAGEIHRTMRWLEEQVRSMSFRVRIAPLYGGLTQDEQDAALLPSGSGERKIVLSTSIAETSLTVEGVRVVIDSGYMRVPRFSPRTGMSRLETVRVSRAATDQRRGRAGRVAPGVCYRLWTVAEDRELAARTTPEMLEADLAPLVLELAVWGTSPAALRWLDPPPAPALAQAHELLRWLGALGAEGAATPHGRSLAALPLHPRLAHMVRCAGQLGRATLACELAALLSERDIARSGGASASAAGAGARAPGADMRLRVEALRGAAPPQLAVDAAACRRVRAEAAALQRQLGAAADRAEGDALADCGVLLAFAYPDRIAERRPDGRYLLRSGRGAMLPGPEPLSQAPYLALAELADYGVDSRIQLAAPLSLSDLERHFADQIEEERLVAWDADARAVRARRRLRFGAIRLKEAPLPDPDPDEVLRALLQGVEQEGLRVLPWSKAATQFRERLQFMHDHEPESWPNATDQGLGSTLAEWLGPHCYGMKKLSDLNQLNMVHILESLLSWEQRRELDDCAPTHITVPSGSRIPVDYRNPEAPILAVRLQEMFGLHDTPRIAHGRVPLTLHLLSPAQRPVQVTRDLASFWRDAYFEVRKDLKGRYPKHYWPDDPSAAVPTNRVRPRT